MRASIVIATHNEGDCLIKTVASCVATTHNEDVEIVVADDMSSDGSVEELHRCYPSVQIARNQQRQGASGTKHLGAVTARGDTLIFMDAHCRPSTSAVHQLLDDIEATGGNAVVAPRLASLNTSAWQYDEAYSGNGYLLNLRTFKESWTLLTDLRRCGRFYEAPNICGACFAVTRDLYFNLGGFDIGMLLWGSEHVDFGWRAWLAGYPILNDVEAVVGHRFQNGNFINYSVPPFQILTNAFRSARKNFRDDTWQQWLVEYRNHQPADRWQSAWEEFQRDRDEVERCRSELLSQRIHDEFWYADEFELEWPKRPEPWQPLSQQDKHREMAPLPLTAKLNQDEQGTEFVERTVHDLHGAHITCRLKLARRPWGNLDIPECEFTIDGYPPAEPYARLLSRIVKGRTVQWLRDHPPQALLGRRGIDASDHRPAAFAAGALAVVLENVNDPLALPTSVGAPKNQPVYEESPQLAAV